MSKFIIFVLLSFSSLCSAATVSNVSKSGLAIEGFDPVSYFSSEAGKKGPAKGDAMIQATHEGVTYQFSSETNKQEFLGNPSKYVPAFGGWCAYAVAEKKEKVEIDPKSFLIQDGRLLLFYKGFLADTRHKWLNNKSKSVGSYLKEADTNWPATMNKEP